MGGGLAKRRKQVFFGREEVGFVLVYMNLIAPIFAL